MTTEGIKELAKQWSPILSPHGIALRITGVYCHQTPKAHYDHPTDGPKSPELGDLLVVHEHKVTGPDGHVETTRRAVIVQAKMVDQGVPRFGKVDRYQEYLYEHWPDFELKGRGLRGTKFLSGQRNFRPNTDTGRYGLIEQGLHARHKLMICHYCCCSPWTYSEPRQPVRTAGGEDAGAFIANMLYDTNWSRGRSAAIPSKPLVLSTCSPSNHFDVTVEELLTLTAAKTLNSKHKPHIRGRRGQTILTCFQVADSAIDLLPATGSGFTPSGHDGSVVPPEGASELDFDDGISIILIETGREGETRRA